MSGGATADRDDSGLRSGEGYEQFMELVGNHVPQPTGYRLLGIRPLHAEPGHVRLSSGVREMLNPPGWSRAAFVTAMLDETMGPAALARSARATPSRRWS